MSEFTLISSFLHEKCAENTDLKKLCSQIAIKYLDSAKMELRAQYIREENIMLKLDFGNLESIKRIVTENNEALAKLDSLLMEFYDEHLKYSFDIDECELEKLASYDEIKYELETRDSINNYQRLYERKLKIAKKMDERNIVKRYRQAEEKLSVIKTQRLLLEEKINKAKDFKARRLEEINLILQLVQGSVELETIYAELYPHKSQSKVIPSGSQRISGFTPRVQLNKRNVGLSSRLKVNFKEFKVPSIPPLPRIRQMKHINGLNHLLQQSEVIRKSMQTAPITLSPELATPKLSGILKTPDNHQKPTEGSQKSVSFDLNLYSDEDVVQKTIETQDSEFESDSEMEAILVEIKTKPEQIKITENLLIKSADKLPKDQTDHTHPKTTIKRKAGKKTSEEHDQSPPKQKFSPSETSVNFGSKSFMEMFMELSNNTPSEVVSTADGETFKKSFEKKNKETIAAKKKDTNLKTKASKKQFDGFEEFISQFTCDSSDSNDDNGEEDKLEGAAGISFDFFQSDEQGQDNGDGCDFSFEL